MLIVSEEDKFEYAPLSTFSTTLKAFRAAHPPIETWSSVPAEVVNESMDDGWQRPLFSETDKNE